VGTLRLVRDRAHDGALIGLSAADPHNLLGTVLPGTRVPRQPGARLLLRDGLAVATLVAGEVEFAADVPPAERPALRRALLREVEPTPFALPIIGA
jgi:ATP-dependent Lhr-like helicase